MVVVQQIVIVIARTNGYGGQVCDRLGFPNTSFFGKYVREHFGVTPIQLRQDI